MSSTKKWQFCSRNGHRWYDYKSDAQEIIEAAFNQNVKTVEINEIEKVTGLPMTFLIDFDQKTQTNKADYKKWRRIRRFEDINCSIVSHKLVEVD